VHTRRAREHLKVSYLQPSFDSNLDLSTRVLKSDYPHRSCSDSFFCTVCDVYFLAPFKVEPCADINNKNVYSVSWNCKLFNCNFIVSHLIKCKWSINFLSTCSVITPSVIKKICNKKCRKEWRRSLIKGEEIAGTGAIEGVEGWKWTCWSGKGWNLFLVCAHDKINQAAIVWINIQLVMKVTSHSKYDFFFRVESRKKQR